MVGAGPHELDELLHALRGGAGHEEHEQEDGHEEERLDNEQDDGSKDNTRTDGPHRTALLGTLPLSQPRFTSPPEALKEVLAHILYVLI